MGDPKTCGTCGQPHDPAKCGGHAKSTSKQCAAWPIKGGKVCVKHGGKAGQVRAAADRRIAETQLESAVKTYGLPFDVSPTDALLDEVKWTAGHVRWLRDRIHELETEALSWGKRSEVDKQSGENPGTDTTHAATAPVLLDLYQRERKHLLDVCRAAIAAGIEERRVRLAESQGALLADVIRRILADLGLTPDQQARVAEVVPRHLRSVA